MVNNQAPQYLSIRARIAPHQPHNHNLRNSTKPPVLTTRTASYQNSFMPSTIKAWRDLPTFIKDAPNISTFKSRLKTKISTTPTHYLIGKRTSQIILANLRTESSNLQYHLFLRYLTEDPSCKCGAPVEDPNHLFKTCPLYSDKRQEILGNITPDTNALLYGYPDMQTNVDLFEKVHRFFNESGRLS